MTANVIIRRRKLGKGSTNGIVVAMTAVASVVRNWIDHVPANAGYVFRWGCTSNVPSGVTVVNTADSIHWCSDKRQGRLDMQAAGVSVPDTWAAEEFPTTLCGDNGEYVLRPERHAQGRHLWTGSFDDIARLVESGTAAGGYVSRLIAKVAEYRVMVCCNRVVWVAQKTPGNPDDVAWNVAQGGRFDNVRWGQWPVAVVAEALKAAKVSKTDFCGVDVMVDEDGTPFVLEVNSAPSQTSPYRQSCLAKAFDYIIENGKEHFPDIGVRNWKDAVHPALREVDE